MTKLGDVACGACHACCRSELIAVLPDEGDKLADYEHDVLFVPALGEIAYLKHKRNGDCFYLGRDGCTIHHRRPHICRIFDCRAFYLSKARSERQAISKGSPLSRVIFNAGRERVKTLDIDELRKVPKP